MGYRRDYIFQQVPKECGQFQKWGVRNTVMLGLSLRMILTSLALVVPLASITITDLFQREVGELWGILASTYVHLTLSGFLLGACGHKKAGRLPPLHLFINF